MKKQYRVCLPAGTKHNPGPMDGYYSGFYYPNLTLLLTFGADYQAKIFNSREEIEEDFKYNLDFLVTMCEIQVKYDCEPDNKWIGI